MTPRYASPMRILVLQQLEIEPPELIGEAFREQSIETEMVLAPHDLIPKSPDGYGGIVIMGGPMSANDDHLPYIREEIRLLRQAIARDLPVLGICLGAQLLAKAAGAVIEPAEARELGWYRLTPTPEAPSDPLFTHLPEQGLTVFQWHGESFSLPEKATLLASCEHVPHQAFRLGSCQYGLQFHVEIAEETIGKWIDAGESERRHLGKEGVAAMLSATPLHLAAMQTFCRDIAGAWLRLLQ